MRKITLISAVVLVMIGCESTADVAGDFTINLTNRENGCAITDWVEGSTTTGITVTITQDGDQVTAMVSGLTATFLDLWLGSHTYQGTVSGSSLDLTLYGDNARSQGNCTYTINSTISATIDGDVLTGVIRYTAATNNNPDCGTLTGCSSRQDFNGSRPPR